MMTISSPRQDAQEAKFTALSGRQALDRGVETSARVLERAHIPLGSQEVSPNEEPPPEYSQGPGKGKQKDSDGFFASLSHSFKAMTANLRPKPDPIVIVTCESAEAGHINHLQGFISHGVNINGHNEDGYTPLICAVRANQVEAVRLLVSAGADLSTQDSHRGKRKPALFHAAECGHLALAELLMDAGASMRARSYWSGQPHFVEVVESSKTNMIKLFLEKGADPNMCAISGRTVFIHAIRAGNMEHVRLLQKYGGDVNARDITGLPALHMALGKNRMDMVDFLLQQGADANSSDLSGNSMLHVASSRKNYELVRKLLHRGANPNTSDYLGRTLLGKLVETTTAENSPDADLALMLLERGADANQCDSWGEKLLYHVLVKGNTSLLKGFLKHRANVNSPFRSQETPLLYTLAHGQLHHTRLLLNHGADPNMRNGEGKTPLMEALLQNDTELVQELLSRGADINACGNVKPAALAKILSNLDIVRLLVQKGADGPTRLPSLVPNAGQAAAPDEAQSPNTTPGGAPGAVAVDEDLPPYAPPP